MHMLLAMMTLQAAALARTEAPQPYANASKHNCKKSAVCQMLNAIKNLWTAHDFASEVDININAS